MSRPVVIVFNPVSGSGRAEELAGRLRAALDQEGLGCTLVPTVPDRDVFSEVDADAAHAVVVIGGDGSLNGAVNGITASEPRIAFCGAGTVNVLTLERGGNDSPERLAPVLAARTLENPGARIPVFTTGGIRGLLFLETGFLARIVREVNNWRKTRRRHGRSEFVRSALRVLPRSWGRDLWVVHEGRRHGPFSNVLLTRARRYAGTMPMPMAPSLRPALETEGFQVVGWRTRSPLGHAVLLTLGGLRLLPSCWRLLRRLGMLESFPARRVRLEGPAESAVHVDAETDFPGVGKLALPLEVGFEGEAIRLLD